MNIYKVKSLNVTGKGNRIHTNGVQVGENDFPPGRAETLCLQGHLELVRCSTKIGVLIPTRGNRRIFLRQAFYLLSRQTFKPDDLEVVDHQPASDEIDITYRYRIGCQRLFERGCEVVIFWEDDDWYAPDYIQTMVTNWRLNGKPPIFGLGTTTYYHIGAFKYFTIPHRHRSSAMSTMVTNAVLKINWGPDNNAYTDVVVWEQLKGKTFLSRKHLCLGIKHDFGLVGGGAHNGDNKHYTTQDKDKSFLKAVVGPDLDFYAGLYQWLAITNPALGTPYGSQRPFLSIITRKYKRPKGLSKNQASVKSLTDQDYEQIFITDDIGKGLYEANRSFQDVSPNGKLVYLLDDDDFIVNPDMITELKQIVKEHDPDVIFFRMIIKNNMNGNYYPTSEICWGVKPVIARIGGSCFVVKNDIYKKFIHNFAHARCGDFHFINAVFESGAKCYWHDKLMCETGRVSHGKPE